MKDFNKLCEAIEEEELSINLDNILRRIRTGAMLSESDVLILTESIEKLCEKIKDLQHYKDSSQGLFVTDITPENIFSRFMKTQSDLSNSETDYLIKLEEDWIDWVKSKDGIFFQLTDNSDKLWLIK